MERSVRGDTRALAEPSPIWPEAGPGPVGAEVVLADRLKAHLNPGSLETLKGCKLEPSLAAASPGSWPQRRLMRSCTTVGDHASL